jgi:alkylhydroperoxidase family enzyme
MAMTLLKQVSSTEVQAPQVLDLYRAVFGDRDPTKEPGTRTGSKGDYWTVIANSPDTFSFVIACNAMQGKSDGVNPLYKELGIVRAAWGRGSQFCFSQHCKALRGLGLSDEKILAITTWQTSELYSDAREREVLALADDLVAGGRVPDDRMHRLQSFLTDEEIVELTYTIAIYEMHSTVLKALKLEFDDRADPVVEVPGPADGAVIRVGPAAN